MKTSPLLRFGTAVVLCLLYFAGRWSFARLDAMGVYAEYYLEPRLWLTAALLILAAMSLAPRIGAPTLATTALRNTTRAALLLVGYCAMTALWGSGSRLSLQKLYDMILVFVWILCAARLLAHDPDGTVRLFWKALLVVGLLLGAIGLATVGDESLKSPTHGGRLSVLGGGPNVYGRNMALAAVACLYFARTTRYRLLSFAGAAIFVVLVVLSGSRGAMIACAGGILVSLLFSRVSLVTRVLALAGLLGAGLLFVWGTPQGEAAQEIWEDRVVELTFEERYISSRDELFEAAVVMGSREPVWGAGLAAYADKVAEYPHNIFLELFAETGLVGVLLLLVLLWISFRLLMTVRSHLVVHTGAALVVVLLSAQFSGGLPDSRGVFLFALLLAASSATRRQESVQLIAASEPASLQADAEDAGGGA